MNYIDKMMEIIKKQFIIVMADDVDFYSHYNIILSNEQQYIKNEDRDPKNIYIVAKFVPGSLNYGQVLYPVTFNALGEGNKLEVAQRLLLDYAQRFNLGKEEEWYETWTDEDNQSHTDHYIAKQVYTQPQVMSNFNTFTNEFRTLFYMTGAFLIGKNSLPITSVMYYTSDDVSEEGIKIDFLSTSWDFSIQLDSQAFYGTDSRTKSKSKIGTLCFNLTVYAMSTPLYNKIRAMAFHDKSNTTAAPKGIKEVFYFEITFADGFTTPRLEFHLSQATSPQTIGEFPVVNLTFTN